MESHDENPNRTVPAAEIAPQQLIDLTLKLKASAAPAAFSVNAP